MQSPLQHFDAYNTSDIDISKLDFSDASIDSIYDLLIDIYGEQTLSADFLTTVTASNPHCTKIDWYTYTDNLLSAHLAFEMALRENEMNQTCLSTGDDDHSCDDTMKEPILDSKTPYSQQKSESLKDKYGFDNAGEEEKVVAKPASNTSVSASLSDSSSIITQSDSPSRKNVRFASPLPTSPSKRLCTEDPHYLPPDNMLILSKDECLPPNSENPSSPEWLSIEEDAPRHGALLDPAPDSEQHFCMSGALPADYVHSIDNELQSVLSVDDNMVCSEDFHLQFQKMPFRLISEDEFGKDWAGAFFSRPDFALRHIGYDFYTTPRGIWHARQISDAWLQEDYDEKFQEISAQYFVQCNDATHPNCRCLPYIERDALLTAKECDITRIEALRYFSGEFTHYRNVYVKFPEHLTSYWRHSEGLENPHASAVARDYWYEIRDRGVEFWDAQRQAEDEAAASMHQDTQEDEKDLQIDKILRSEETKSQEEQNSPERQGRTRSEDCATVKQQQSDDTQDCGMSEESEQTICKPEVKEQDSK